MALNLVNLFGIAGAARFLQLAASPVRYPCDSLKILNRDRSLMVDLTDYLDKVDIGQSDTTNKSEMTTYTLTNPNCYFDEYIGGAGSAYLAMDTLVQYQKGLIDMTPGSAFYGTRFLVPAAFGKITQTREVISRAAEIQMEISTLDLFKNPLKRKVTTDQYIGQLPNAIATDIAERYMALGAGNIQLGNTGSWPAYSTAQFPDMTPVDILQMLYAPLNYFVRIDEAGNLVSGPRLGSSLSGFAGLLGYPDQLTAPPDAAVAYTIPDALSLVSIEPINQDYTFYNQVRALGKALNARTQLGPQQRLFKLDDSTIDSVTHIQQSYSFSQNSSGQNAVLAENVIVVFRYSTAHNLDGAPQFMCFSADGSGKLPPGVPAGTPIYAANAGHPDVENSDPNSVGYLALTAVTLANVVVKIEGRQFSSGHISTRHHGGFDYNMQIWGNPVVSYTKTLTAFADYNPVLVQDLALPAYGTVFAPGAVPYGDLFNDHQTYQLPQAPIAKGTTVELKINPSTLPNTTLAADAHAGDQSLTLSSLSNLAPGIALRVNSGAALEYAYVGDQPATGYVNPVPIAAALEYSHASGTTAVGVTGAVSADADVLSSAFNVDWDRGRIVLYTLLYRTFSEDDDASHPLSSTINPTAPILADFSNSHSYSQAGTTFDMSALDVATPAAIYSTKRLGDTQYLFTGLVPGQAYSLRLHFADDQSPTSAGQGTTVFSIYAQTAILLQDFDIYVAAGGALTAIQQLVEGVVADFAGNITVWITQHDPYSGEVLTGSRATDWTLSNGHTQGASQICGIEVIPSQGQGAPPFSVNSGGPAITPAVPTVTVTYGYSPNQQIYGIQSTDIDDPLVQTHDNLKQMAQYALNKSAWGRHTQKIIVSTLPWLQPGDLIKYYVRKLNKDFWAYIPTLSRSKQRPKKGSNDGGTDTDTYSVEIIYARNRV